MTQRGSVRAVVLILLFVSSVFVGAASGVADTQSPDQLSLIDLWGSSPSFEVSLTAPETAAGTNITAAVTVTNTGDQAGSTELTTSDETATLNTTQVRLDSGANTTIIVERETTVDDIGTINLTAATPETTATTTATVTDPIPPAVTAVGREPTITNSNVRVNATFEPGSVPIENAYLELAAEFAPVTRSVPVATQLEDNGDVETTFEVAELPADGTYTPRGVATGPVGQSDTTTARSVTVDTTPPKLQFAAANITGNSSLIVDPDEPVTVTDGGITITNATGVDRSPAGDAIPDGLITDSVTIPFEGVAGENGTVTAMVTATDEAGNRNTQTLTAAVTPYSISENGTAVVEPTDNSSITVNTAGAVNRSNQTAVVQRGETAPPGTRLTPRQVGAGFLTVSDIGLADAELTNATVTIELDGVAQETVSSFDNSSLRILRSAADDTSYQPVATMYNETDHTVTATVDELGQFAVAGIDTTEPSITTTNVTPGQTIPPTAGSATVAYEYTDTETGVDPAETTLAAAVDADRTTTQIEPTGARIEIEQPTPGETIIVGLNVTDTAGNSQTTLEQIRVAEANAENGSAANRDLPSAEQLQDILQLVGPERTVELPVTDAEPTADGLTVRVDDAETVSAIRFTEGSPGGRLSVTEYGAPPQPIADAIVASAVRDSEGGAADSEDGEQTAAIEVHSVVDITPTVAATANTTATVELAVDNSTVDTPERLTVLTATEPSAPQQPAWEGRETTISERGDGEITLQTAVDSLSLLAIVETDGDTQQIGTSDAGGDRSGGRTLLAVAVGIVTVLLVAVLIARRLRNKADEEIDPEETEFEWNPLEDS
ncbi:MAG: hypothetical protein J07HN4v3_01932 [Halonotius sp. J07HN4]|nr:MAG: hypothetical protein J07HN4v3_01932 [Halonotius sp. J07HN4]